MINKTVMQWTEAIAKSLEVDPYNLRGVDLNYTASIVAAAMTQAGRQGIERDRLEIMNAVYAKIKE